MALTELTLTAVRNLEPVSLHPSLRINLLHGVNGSGKTSLLEAIHLLGMGRSFRGSKPQASISHQQSVLTVFGRVVQGDGRLVSLGISRNIGGALSIRIDGKTSKTLAPLALALPIQLINQDSFRLLEGPPSVRRQLIDWGAFHVEPGFYSAWKRLQLALQQRNSWLRHGIINDQERLPWDQQFCLAAEEVDRYRHNYVMALQSVFAAILTELSPLEGINLSYRRGWDRRRNLSEALEANLERDRQMGFTYSGPQRADLVIRQHGQPATDKLSRGQQKMVVSALRLAQARLLSETRHQDCVFLIDDLPSELDPANRTALCRILERLGTQAFITGIERQALEIGWDQETPIGRFHVEHGHIHQEQ